jgi:hypothetical protein
MIPATTSMREYAVAKTGTLLEEAVAAIQHAAETPDESAVHKMRVAIRRLQQALRLFRQYLKSGGVEHVKTRLRAIMQIAGELRNRDIGIELLADAGGDTAHFAKQRLAYNQQLSDVLEQYANPQLLEAWRHKLGLDVV